MYQDVRGDRLAQLGLAARRILTLPWLPPVLVVAVALDDAFLLPRAPSYAVLGLFDEPAHLATSVVLLAALSALRRDRVPSGAFVVGVLLGGNIIDADHVPDLLLGSQVLTSGTPRPYTHSLTTVLVLGVGALIARRRGHRRATAVAAGLAAGVAGHLVRDLATAPVALLWPASSAGLTMPHAAYLAVLVAGAALAAVMAGRAGRSGRSGRAQPPDADCR